MKPSPALSPPASEEGPPPSGALIALTLFASYCLGANGAIALHEFGHALGCWLAGGKMRGLVLSPQGYAGSYAARDVTAGFSIDCGYLITIAGGLAFGAAFGVILVLVARLFSRGTVGWIVTYATGTWAIGNNGMYLFLGSLQPFDDALSLTEEGVPRWFLFIAGLPLVLVFLALFASFLRGIGLRPKDSYWRWVLTVESGVLLYLAMIVAARLLWPGPGNRQFGGEEILMLTSCPLVLLLLGSCSYALRRPIRRCESPAVGPRWTNAGALLAIALLFLAVELLFFSCDFAAAAIAQPELPRASDREPVEGPSVVGVQCRSVLMTRELDRYS